MLAGLLTPAHVGLLLIALLLIFGPKRLPETGRALGRGIHEFKDATTRPGDTSGDADSASLAASQGLGADARGCDNPSPHCDAPTTY